MLVTLMVALFAEGIHISFGRSLGRQRHDGIIDPLREIFRSMTIPISIPEASVIRLSIYMPCFALAALIPIAASIPFFHSSRNGQWGDLVQILQFAALSETLAILAVFSLGTTDARITAERMTR